MPLPSPEAEPTRRLIAAYDLELRGAAEFFCADQVVRLGPLWAGVFDGHGFVSHSSIEGVSAPQLAALIAEVIAHYRSLGVDSFEWKTRGHDRTSGLEELLLSAGLVPDDPETVMIGERHGFAATVELPPGCVLRRVGADGEASADVAAVGRLHAEVFTGHTFDHDAALLARLQSENPSTQLWVVEADSQIVSTGRMERQGRFAGLFGGATRADWRGRGLYRALTDARAGAAAEAGAEFVYAECTPFSRPILQRCGLTPVTSTTPYIWQRETA